MTAIDDLLDAARDPRRWRDEAGSDLAASVRALDGTDGVGTLAPMETRELARLHCRPRASRSNGSRPPAKRAGRAAPA